MYREINVTKNVLRYLRDGHTWVVKRILFPKNQEDKLKWFLLCIYDEVYYLNCDGEYRFQNEIKQLSDMVGLNLSIPQVNILSDLIGGFKHKHRIPIPVEKMYAIPKKIIEELTELLINKEVFLDTHIAVRRDLDYYESVYQILEYEKYKELVFATICRTTTCSNGAFNPMKNIHNKVHLKQKDYETLCIEIFS